MIYFNCVISTVVVITYKVHEIIYETARSSMLNEELCPFDVFIKVN